MRLNLLWEMVRDTPRKYPSSDDPIHDDAGRSELYLGSLVARVLPLGEGPSRRRETLVPKNQGNGEVLFEAQMQSRQQSCPDQGL